MADDMRKLLKRVERLGFMVEERNGHVKVRGERGELLVTLPGTPSDRRSVSNAIATLRRNGIPVRNLPDKRRGSANDVEAENVRRRLSLLLDGKKTTVSEIARATAMIAEARNLVPFKNESSANTCIRRLLGGGSMTKSKLDIVSAAVREAEGRPAPAEIRKAKEERQSDLVAIAKLAEEMSAPTPKPDLRLLAVEAIRSLQSFLSALESQLEEK